MFHTAMQFLYNHIHQNIVIKNMRIVKECEVLLKDASNIMTNKRLIKILSLQYFFANNMQSKLINFAVHPKHLLTLFLNFINEY